MKSIIKKSTLVALMAANCVNAGSFSEYFPSDLFSTSLVMLEAAIPAPHTLVDLQEARNKEAQKDLVLVDNSVQINTEEKNLAESEEARLKKLNNKKNKKTTLTIVQDFPKKAADQNVAPSINLVQDNSTVAVNETKPIAIADNNKTATIDLIIGQDFPKKAKKDNNIAGNVEMVQGQEANTRLHFRKNGNDK